MLSKWLPWDFFNKFQNSIQTDRPGLYTVLTFDPFITRLFQDNLPQNHFEGGKISIIMGRDITCEWLDANLCSLSFFGNSESYFVHSAEEIPKDAQTFLIEREIDFTSRYMILSFAQDLPFRKKVVDKLEGEHIVIQPPPFWEIGKLLDFLADQHKVRLSFDARTFLLNSVENNCADFWMALNILKLNYPDHQSLSLEQVTSVMGITRLDQFELASLFSAKKKAKFYEKLLEIENDFDDLRSLFSFMQSHLIKVLDISYAAQKARPSKYDREIFNHARLWDKIELQKDIRRFGELEIMAKQRNDYLFPTIRSIYFQELVG